MVKIKSVEPVLKWVGGKRQILSEIVKYVPKDFETYIEPFIGGGAVLFHLQPDKAIVNDYNAELINVYQVIKDNVEALIVDLEQHPNDAKHFYDIRALDRSPEYQNLTNVERAARILYLNKTCFNGLYRVNNSGEFNSPFGGYRNPNIVNEAALRAASEYFNANQVDLKSGDYTEVLAIADKGSFIYLDPPYDPVSKSSNFTGYIKGGWDCDAQVKLREACDDLTSRSIKFLLSNSATDFIRSEYADYQIETIQAKRSINATGTKRGAVDELLIRNY